ncbi:putative nicotinate phosphoribosyltransferase [Rhodopirellula rubra]|uniref:Putative nicotinate phosphoribosyltransferase n=1 Tax=Aporhodopirellula rubra TaxID=980271 RepID=A0A7W5H925_9BACT|nr:hypothetical protein [Aporhodopirellula rubra]MBB3210068.1 putative nicotinate phosphoribosyltransferase [Aporhodopirellula rubra]
MNLLAEIYRPSLSLLTDLYQLTMSYGYWKNGLADRTAVFHLFFRSNPFDGGYSIACGLQSAIEYLENLRFDTDDLTYLGSLTGADAQPLFDDGFLDYLGDLSFELDVDAIPEGTTVFPHERLFGFAGRCCSANSSKHRC